MMTNKTGTTRDGSGRYNHQAKCDGCGKAAGKDFASDTEVCGGSDGPGFFLCSRARCEAKRPDGLDARRAHYAAQRAVNTEVH